MNKLENGQTSIVTQNKGSKSGDTIPFKVMYNPQEHCQHTLPDVLSPPFCNLILLKYLSMQEEGERGGEGNWKNCLSFSLLLSLNLSPFVLWTSRLGRGRGGQSQLYNLHKKVYSLQRLGRVTGQTYNLHKKLCSLLGLGKGKGGQDKLYNLHKKV